MIRAYEQNTYRMPLITTVPITASGTLRRGLRVSSASGAAASNPPNASTASENAMKMSLVPDPPGQWNGVAGQPLGAALGQHRDGQRQQQHHLEHVEHHGGAHAELEAEHDRGDHQGPVRDGDDLGDAPDVRVVQHVLHDVLADEDVDPAERDDVSEQGDHPDDDRGPHPHRPGDVGQERPGAREHPGEQGQAGGRGDQPDHADQEHQRDRGAGEGGHQPGGEEQVERGRDLGQARHEHAEQADLAARQRGPGGRGGGRAGEGVGRSGVHGHKSPFP